MTIEGVQSEEVSQLADILEERYNSKIKKAKKRMPLRKKRTILEGLNPPNALWGHVKINGKESAKKVLTVLEKMSEVVPRLTWILYSENRIFSGELFLKAGRILNQ